MKLIHILVVFGVFCIISVSPWLNTF